MSRFDDYINGLEGKENLDPVVIASTLLELHNEEISVFETKINERDGVIAERDTALVESGKQLDKQKLRNYDLALQIPSDQKPVAQDVVTEDETPSIDELIFGKAE